MPSYTYRLSNPVSSPNRQVRIGKGVAHCTRVFDKLLTFHRREIDGWLIRSWHRFSRYISRGRRDLAHFLTRSDRFVQELVTGGEAGERHRGRFFHPGSNPRRSPWAPASRRFAGRAKGCPRSLCLESPCHCGFRSRHKRPRLRRRISDQALRRRQRDKGCADDHENGRTDKFSA